MSEALENLANSRFDFKAAKMALLERIDSQLVFPYEGGMFKATPELLCLCEIYKKEPTIVLMDEYRNPILCDPVQLMEHAASCHQYAMNAYWEEFNKLQKVRKGDKL